MSEKTFTETEIREALIEVAKSYHMYDEIMDFHSRMLIENILVKVESAIFNGGK